MANCNSRRWAQGLRDRVVAARRTGLSRHARALGRPEQHPDVLAFDRRGMAQALTSDLPRAEGGVASRCEGANPRRTLGCAFPSPHPNSGLARVRAFLDGRSRVNPTSAGEGLGVGGRACEAPAGASIAPPPSPTRGEGADRVLLHECTHLRFAVLFPRLRDRQ